MFESQTSVDEEYNVGDIKERKDWKLNQLLWKKKLIDLNGSLSWG